MNKKDILIVTRLRKNARESLTKMSKKTRIPISTIHERLKSYGGNIIQKHTALINFSKLGYMSRAHIMLKVKSKDKQEIKDYLYNHPRVNSLYRINNGFDFLVEGIFRNIEEMEDFFDKVEDRFSILDKDTYYIVNDIKREEFMTDPLFMEI